RSLDRLTRSGLLQRSDYVGQQVRCPGARQIRRAPREVRIGAVELHNLEKVLLREPPPPQRPLRQPLGVFKQKHLAERRRRGERRRDVRSSALPLVRRRAGHTAASASSPREDLRQGIESRRVLREDRAWRAETFANSFARQFGV